MKYGIGFLTKKEKNQLMNIIYKSVISWSEEWLNSDTTPVVDLEEYSTNNQSLLEDNGFTCFNDNQKVGFLINSQEFWVKVLFKKIEKIIPIDDLTIFLIESAKKDLLVKIYGNSELSYIGNNLIHIDDINFSGIPVIVNIDLGYENFQILLDSSLLNTKNDMDIVDIPNNNSIAIDTVSNETVTLSAKFELDKLSVQDFLDIQVGDVIKSSHSIVESFSIFCKEKEIALGSLGQSENHRAILLTSKHEITK